MLIHTLKKLAFSWLQKIYFLSADDITAEIAHGSNLIIAPHADDETLGCGATILRARSFHQPVRIIIVTDGTASNVNEASLLNIRKHEAIEAARILGCTDSDIQFLGFKDGMASLSVAAIAEALEREIHNYQPARIFSPYGDDGHADHRAVAAAITLLCDSNKISCPVYEYPIWFWPWRAMQCLLKPLELRKLRRVESSNYLTLKRQALAAHRSQHKLSESDNKSWALEERFIRKFFVRYELFFKRDSFTSRSRSGV